MKPNDKKEQLQSEFQKKKEQRKGQPLVKTTDLKLDISPETLEWHKQNKL